MLVAILLAPRDLDIAREQHWYRIPVRSVQRFLKERWLPDWLAFYQPKAFGEEAYAVRYYARVVGVRKASRYELFPDEPINEAQVFLILNPQVCRIWLDRRGFHTNDA